MIVRYDEDREFGIIACDHCSLEDEFEGYTFAEFWGNARAEGWRVATQDAKGVWQHECPACREASRKGAP
jgi:hypothetical protein